MADMQPIVDVFFAQEPGGWRVYFAAESWCPPMLRSRLDAQQEAHVRRFDATALGQFMWRGDAPYELRPSKAGGAQIVARGRSAIVFAEWVSAVLPASARADRVLLRPAKIALRLVSGARTVARRRRQDSMRSS